MADSNPDYLKDHDHLLAAKQQMGQYWNREAVQNDLDADTRYRIAELLQVLAESSVSIAESLHQLATGERARS